MDSDDFSLEDQHNLLDMTTQRGVGLDLKIGSMEKQTLDMDSSETTCIAEGFENIPIITTGINPAIEVETGLGIQDQVVHDIICPHFYGKSV